MFLVKISRGGEIQRLVERRRNWKEAVQNTHDKQTPIPAYSWKNQIINQQQQQQQQQNQTKKQTNNQQPDTQPDYYLVVVGPRVVKVNHVGPLLAVGGEHVGGTHPVPGKGQEENSLPLKMD